MSVEKINTMALNDFINGKTRCPVCAGNKKLKFDDIKNKVVSIDCDYEVLDSESEFKNVHSPILFRHKECDRCFYKSYNNFRNGQRCPHCVSEARDSKEVAKLKKYFDSHSIKYETEVTFPDLKYTRCLRIDFYLPDIGIYIEYDGKQHFEYSENGLFTKSYYEDLKIKDNMKDEYFKNNNLILYRINYKENTIKRIKEILEFNDYRNQL